MHRLLDRFIDWFASTHETSWPFYRFFKFMLLMVPLGILATLSYLHIDHALTESALLRAHSLAVPVAAALEERFDRVSDAGTSFATHPQLRSLIISKKWSEAVTLLQVFKTLSSEPFIDRIFITDAKGVLRAGFPETGTEGMNFSYRDWYKGVVDAGRPYLSESYERVVEPHHNVTALAVPVKDDSGALAGIIVLQMRVDHLVDWARYVKKTDPQTIMIVDQRGTLVAHSTSESTTDSVDVSAEASGGISRGESGLAIERAGNDTEETIGAYAAVRKYSWGVIIEESSASFFAARDAVLRSILMIYAAAFLLAAFFFSLLLESIERVNMRSAHKKTPEEDNVRLS